MMTEKVFKPRFAPRGFVDGLIAACAGSFVSVILSGLPALVGYLISQNVMVALLFAMVGYVVLVLFSVSKIAISPAGIRFSRILGTPKLLPWDAVTHIEEASRRELIVRGWFWPLFPPRELSTSLSCEGHFRIEFGGKSVYFPPHDKIGFVAAAREYIGERVGQPIYPEAAAQPGPVQKIGKVLGYLLSGAVVAVGLRLVYTLIAVPLYQQQVVSMDQVIWAVGVLCVGLCIFFAAHKRTQSAFWLLLANFPFWYLMLVGSAEFENGGRPDLESASYLLPLAVFTLVPAGLAYASWKSEQSTK